ncbi:MAG: hypothetical protein RL030_1792 [Pseudomonadota bacterium]|jgi:hypothetical protein
MAQTGMLAIPKIDDPMAVTGAPTPPATPDVAAAPTAANDPKAGMLASVAAPAAPDAKSSMLSDWYQDYMAKPPKPAAWTPGADSTVAGQIGKITTAGGPLMDQAETAAKQTMNSRGLLNSSMAITAGQDALYRAALPIASQDANTNARAGEFNAGALNAATAQQVDVGARYGLANLDLASRTALQAADAANQQKLQSFQQAHQTAQAELDRAQQAAMTDKSIGAQQALQTAQQGFQKAQAELDRAQETAIAKTQQEFQAKQLVQQQANALEQMGYANKLATAQVPAQYASTISAATMNQVNAILADPNLDETAKKNAVDNVVNFANSTLSWAEKFYSVDLPGITTPTGLAAAAPTPAAPAPVAAPPAGGLINSGGYQDQATGGA